jgi:hypothetical protein
VRFRGEVQKRGSEVRFRGRRGVKRRMTLETPSKY